MQKENRFKMFLSYSWKQTDIANQIDNSFKALGIDFIRDIRDAEYHASIKQYMKLIRTSDYALLLISDEFLRSKNCMYEVLEMIKEEDYKSRILLIITENAKIYEPIYRLDIMKYWKAVKDNFEKEIKEISPEDLGDEGKTLKQYKEIQMNIGEFLTFTSDSVALPFESLKKHGYKPILKFIGYGEMDNLSKLLDIDRISDKKTKIKAIDEFIFTNPYEPLGYFFKAYNISDDLEKIANYDKCIRLDDENWRAYVNRATAKDRIGKYQEAIIDYIRAIELNPDSEEAYHSRGLARYLNDDNSDAVSDFNCAIAINPNYGAAYCSRGMARSRDYDKGPALDDFKRALELNPEDSDAYCARGRLYYRIKEFKSAREDFERASKLGNTTAKEILLNIVDMDGIYEDPPYPD